MGISLLCVDDKFIVGLLQRAAAITARGLQRTLGLLAGQGSLSLKQDRDCNKMSPESNVTLFHWTCREPLDYKIISIFFFGLFKLLILMIFGVLEKLHRDCIVHITGRPH